MKAMLGPWALPGDPWKFLEQILLASTEPWKPFLPPPRPPTSSALTVRKLLATAEDTVWSWPSKGSLAGPEVHM